VTPYVVGAVMAVAVAALGRVTRFDEDRSFYATILVVIAAYYILFALQGDSTGALVGETAIATGRPIRCAAFSVAGRDRYCRPWPL
jgi:hypothetical protein